VLPEFLNYGHEISRAAIHLTTLRSPDTLANTKAVLPEWLTINLAQQPWPTGSIAAKHLTSLLSSATLANILSHDLDQQPCQQ
jgi:hypothetical protein